MENEERAAHLEYSSGEDGAHVGSAGEPLASRRRRRDGHGGGQHHGVAALPMEFPGGIHDPTSSLSTRLADRIPSSRRNLRSVDSETSPSEGTRRSVGTATERHRARGLATPLPPAFPPLPREAAAMGDGGDGASSTSSSRTSPEIDGSRVSAAGLDVANELELSVPSHQEHLTADGQR